MILQRLCEAATHFDFPPPGYTESPIKWIIDLDPDGRCLGFVSTAETDKPNDRGNRMLHPFVSRTSGVAAQLLADKASYVLSFTDPEASERQTARAEKAHAAFKALVRRCAEHTSHEPVRAVVRFLDQNLADASLPRALDPGHMVTFRVAGSLPIDHAAVRGFWAQYASQSRQDRTTEETACLVCGQFKPIADRMPIKVKRIPGGQTPGCTIVSANDPAFESYGRAAALISPVCWDCAELHATVLSAMLADPSYSFRLQDRLAYVFWTRESSDFSAANLLSTAEPDDVRRLLESVHKPGGDTTEDTDAFYALAVSGSGGRVVIRDWVETTLKTVKQNLARYFEAQRIVAPDGSEGRPIGMYPLLGALIPSAGQDPWKELPPDLIARVVNTALLGNPLPGTLLQRAVARARSEQGLTRPRAAVIKMSLLLSTHREEAFKVTERLNMHSNDPAYVCGRLLAILEGVQRAAVPGIKATLVDRYYGTASSAPASVFGNLMRQAQAHLGKLRKEKPGAYTRLQEALEDTAGRLPALPHTLTLIDQGKFALGYYHQRAADRAARDEAVAAKKARESADTPNTEEEQP